MSLIELKQAVIEGNSKVARALAKQVVENPGEIDHAIDQGIKKALETVGVRFAKGEYFIPDVMLSVLAANAAFKIFKPFFKRQGASVGTVLMGTVEGDIHDIGKNIAIALLQAGGFEVVDLGVDVPPSQFVSKIRKLKPQVVGLSALLSTALTSIERTVLEIKEAGLRDKVKIMVGGSAVTPEFAKEVGADGYGADATDAPKLAQGFIK